MRTWCCVGLCQDGCYIIWLSCSKVPTQEKLLFVMKPIRRNQTAWPRRAPGALLTKSFRLTIKMCITTWMSQHLLFSVTSSSPMPMQHFLPPPEKKNPIRLPHNPLVPRLPTTAPLITVNPCSSSHSNDLRLTGMWFPQQTCAPLSMVRSSQKNLVHRTTVW